MRGMVVAVSRSPTHTLQKPNAASIRLVAGLGVEGDANRNVTKSILGNCHDRASCTTRYTMAAGHHFHCRSLHLGD